LFSSKALAEAFSKHLRTIGFDIDGEKLEGLKRDNNEGGVGVHHRPCKDKRSGLRLDLCSDTCGKVKRAEPILRGFRKTQALF
jgi:hypothetical protein